ncbi:sensor histidine kinase [Stenotrophomonas tumulicola]|uniref:histidine kinase n=1 Tax=Stenotrophomonas tumulicola TaxID=1685415 RepID=A0A7W3IFV6_9GAMM|nr:ATP-binding protein [Stenotrophomonas tumulicola]MBA8680255.1 histidine kinase [Stenotrophomonas tumulicola]
MLKRLSQWFQRVPIIDPVERRNAVAMQALLLFLGITVPLNWWLHASLGMVSTGTLWVMVVDNAAALFGFVLIALIRRGSFRLSVVLFSVSMLATMSMATWHFGLLRDQTSQMLCLVVSGLFLGRRALWTVFTLLLLISCAGGINEINGGTARLGGGVQIISLIVSFAMSYMVVAVVIDLCITALRRSLAESELRGQRLQEEMAERERTQAQLVQSQKLEATGRLASGVAHDFDNILNLMTGFASERHRLDDPDYSSAENARALAFALEGVDAAARRGMSLTRRLLSFARPDVSRPERFDAGVAVTELMPMLRQSFGPQVRLKLDCANVPMPVYLDRDQFDLMLLNIASNARDAMPEGGVFEVAASPAADGASVDLCLRDSGVGMNAHVLSQAFEPFFSTKPAGQGTGLGLAVIHGLMRTANGVIDIQSAPGQGTTLHLRLPLQDPDAQGLEARSTEGSKHVAFAVDGSQR